MRLTEENLVVVAREFEWKMSKSNFEKHAYGRIEDKYQLSDVIEIDLADNKTKWQIIIYNDTYQLYTCLHKIESISNCFSVIFSGNVFPNESNIFSKRYITPLHGDWIYLTDLTNMYITLKFKIELEEAHTKLFHMNTTFSSRFEKLLYSEKFSDFTFICSDGKEFPAHRFVLASNSIVLATMLEVPMKESKTNTTKVDDIDGDTMMELLRFMYAGRIENAESVAPNLLYCAEKYEIDKLKELCGALMIKNLSIENALEYFVLAHRYYEKYLLTRCIIFIKLNYDELHKNENWKKMDAASKCVIESVISVMPEIQTIKGTELTVLPKSYKAYGSN